MAQTVWATGPQFAKLAASTIARPNSQAKQQRQKDRGPITWEELMRRFSLITAMASAALLFEYAVYAQQPAAPAAAPPAPPPPLGAPITLEQAKKVALAAEAEAKKNNWTYAVAIVEPSGALVYFQRMDGTQYGSLNVAIDKARRPHFFGVRPRCLTPGFGRDPRIC
jgi:hypothetical protein